MRVGAFLWTIASRKWLHSHHQERRWLTLSPQVKLYIRESQLIHRDATVNDRHQRSLELLLLAEQDINHIIEDIKDTLEDHARKGEAFKGHAAVAAQESADGSDVEDEPTSDEKGKGKDVAHDHDESEKGGIHKTAAEATYLARGNGLRLRLRECLVTEHEIKFFQGNAYNMLGDKYSNEEAAAYAEAENARRRLLSSKCMNHCTSNTSHLS
jgi:E3 ubiquitin-protein ligase SHPRH